MKKVILAQTIVMTVLMGCSFSKETGKEHLIEANKVQKEEDSFQSAILTASSVTLQEILATKSPSQMNINFADGSTPLENAALRGNRDIAKLVIKAGGSPFKINSKTGVSIFLESVPATKTSLRSSSILLEKYMINGLAKRFISKNIDNFVGTRNYDGLLEYLELLEVPASIVLNNFKYSRYERIPAPVVARLISLPSFINDQTVSQTLKDPVDLFKKILEDQLETPHPSLSLLEFLTHKYPEKIFGIRYYCEQEDITFYVNPALLLNGRNAKYKPKHSHLAEKLNQLSRFSPGDIALYCKGNCDSSEANNIATAERMSQLTNKALQTIIEDALADQLNSFWGPDETEGDAP